MDFSKYLIKKYKYWSVYIHQNQSYLGRCYVWCERDDANELTDASDVELKEMKIILIKTKNALTELFKPDWFNYAFLGNETPHLHGHIIPRYAEPREYKGIRFEDKLFGRNYRSDRKFFLLDETLMSIKEEIIKKIK